MSDHGLGIWLRWQRAVTARSDLKSPAAKYVAVPLLQYVDNRTGRCRRVTEAALGAQCGLLLTEERFRDGTITQRCRTVRRATSELQRIGALIVIDRNARGSVYQLVPVDEWKPLPGSILTQDLGQS